MAQQFLLVALASSLRQSFHYLPEAARSASDYLQGSRVRVPFGSRTIIGIVVGHSDESPIDAARIKPVLERLDDTPLLDSTLLQLMRWVADYYQHPLGDSLVNCLPVLLRKYEPQYGHWTTTWELTSHAFGLGHTALARAPAQQSCLQSLFDRASEMDDPVVDEETLKTLGHKRTTLRELEKKELLRSGSRPAYPMDTPGLVQASASGQPRDLNTQQREAVVQIQGDLGQFKPTLLQGVTGSGKTEVYLQAITSVLAAGKQALVLVPEIGLTPQTIRRFQSRFDTRIAIFHSGLTDRERLLAWNAARTGIAGIVIGTRSAIFTPLASPGLIVVDEEHDLSYKQQEGIRYSARDTAIMRAQLENVPVVLGSATPSLESLQNCAQSKYQRLTLDSRAGDAEPASIELLDIRHSELHHGLCDNTITEIAATLDRGEQAMVFVNRRGFSPLLLCHDCGWYAECTHCDARMTMHLQPRRLHCHHCDSQAGVPSQCPRCQSQQLISLGQGTERSADALAALFPQQPIVRVDRDTVQGKESLNHAIDQVMTSESAILVGTQMLAKGHHFPRLTTVVVLDIDQGLFSADFRGPEKTLQLLTQVAGRAGRASRPGKVLIQTHLPDHPLLIAWQEQGYDGIANALLAEREERQLPPFAHLACLRADSPRSGRAMEFLGKVRNAALENAANRNNTPAWLTIGPLPAIMERRAGRHRAQMMVKTVDRKTLRQLCQRCIATMEENGKSGLRWSIDIDPQEVL